MTKVILLGCNGRMGKVLAALIEPMDEMEVIAGIDIHSSQTSFPVFSNLSECSVKADALIDFSHPGSLPLYIPEAAKRKLPVVVATTGLSSKEIELLNGAAVNIPVFRSANMSLGINLLQKLVKSAATILGEAFDIEIVEKHHKLKKDSPSGTALMLADSINEAHGGTLEYVFGREGGNALRKKGELGIHAFRGGTIVGEHDVFFAGTDELIQIGHKAYSRQVFATGAIAAARFLKGQKPGMYSMEDLINQTTEKAGM